MDFLILYRNGGNNFVVYNIMLYCIYQPQQYIFQYWMRFYIYATLELGLSLVLNTV